MFGLEIDVKALSSAILGGVVAFFLNWIKYRWDKKREKANQKHKLQRACLDKRLDVIQQAYIYWYEIKSNLLNVESVKEKAIEAKEFWISYNLYLDSNLRDKYIKMTNKAISLAKLKEADHEQYKRDVNYVLSFWQELDDSVYLEPIGSNPFKDDDDIIQKNISGNSPANHAAAPKPVQCDTPNF